MKRSIFITGLACALGVGLALILLGRLAGPSSAAQQELPSTPPTDVSISGPMVGFVNQYQTFIAQVSPPSASQPITYSWQATGQSPVTHTNGLSDTVNWSWYAASVQTVTVAAANDSGIVTDSITVAVFTRTQPISMNVEWISQLGGTMNGVAVQGNYAYVGVGYSLQVINISIPNHPTVVGQTHPMPDIINKVAVSGTLAYVADNFGGLRIVDVSDPANPREVGTWNGAALCVAVAGRYAYVGEWSGMHVIDVSNPTSPQHTGFIRKSVVYDLAVAGHYVYVGAVRNIIEYRWGLWIVDVSDPTHPRDTGHLENVIPFGLAVAGNYAYIANAYSGFRIVDISDPAHPALVSALQTQGPGESVAVANGYAYVPDYYGLSIIDISEPITPTQTAHYSITGGCWNVAVAGKYAYVAAMYDGLHILDVSDPAAPREAGKFHILASPSGLAISGAFAYVADGERGLGIVNISDPAHPFKIGGLDTPGAAHGVAVDGPYAYVADGEAGLRIINALYPVSPFEISAVDTPGHAQGVTLADNYAYVADGSSGLHIIKVKDPADPSEVGSYDTPGNAQGVAVAGNYAYIADGIGGLRIINVANRHYPAEAGVYTMTGSTTAVAVKGDYAYVVGDNCELHIVSISDPANPTKIASYTLPGSARGVAVTDDGLAYIADGYGDLRIISVSDPAHPAQVGFHELPGFAYGIAVAGDYAYLVGADTVGWLSVLRYRPSPPTADFVAYPTSGMRPLTVAFADTSTGGATSWLWDMGDGDTSTLPNPTHIYRRAGVYNVSLHVSNSLGSNMLTRVRYITVIGPQAQFAATPTIGTSPLTVTFTNQSIDYTSNLWDLGDGNTSTLTNLTHIYTTLGTYTVTLTVDGPDGSDTEIKPYYIAVVEPKAYLPLILYQSP